MKINNLARACAVVFAIVMLAGCPSGGTDESVLGSGGGDTGGSGTAGGGSTTSDTSNERSVTIGSFNSSGAFVAGTVGTNKTTLKAGESASLSVSLRDQDGNPVTEAVDVFFTSPCASSGTSEFSSPIVTNSSGTVTVTYTARGCDDTDLVRAQTSVDGSSLAASVSLQTAQAPLGTIGFFSVSNNVIGIKGTGFIPEQATVTFRVTNTSGGPVPNQVVDFSLNTSVGDIELDNDQNTTDADGLVSTTVLAGTVATPVRVTATTTLDGKTVSAVSSALAISTGIPDQNSFSLSANAHNIEGWGYNGETSEITIFAADRFNNPVPDGTAISFIAEGGSIQPSCLTSGGVCSVLLTSQDPRPANGRVSVLAYAIGEESFTDANPSNGRFEDAESFDDLPESFLDSNENSVRDSDEFYVDFNKNSMYDLADALFNGLLCDGPGLCAAVDQETLIVSQNDVIVFSGSDFSITLTENPIDLTSGDGKFVGFLIQDINGQVPPVDTTVKITPTGASLVGPSTFPVPDTNADGGYENAFYIMPSTPPAESSHVLIEVTTPKGNTTFTVVPVVQ